MFKKVIIGVDGASGGRDAVALAQQLAAADAVFGLAHIYGAGLMPGHAAGQLLAAELQESCTLLETERRSAVPSAELFPLASHRVGDGLHTVCGRFDADLLVVGSSRRGAVGRVLLGDDTLESLNNAPCAVAIAPAGHANTAHPFAAIGLGYDGSRESWRAHSVACALAERSRAKLRSLAVSQHADPGETLAALGDEVDLLIIGSRGRGRLARRLRGSTSNYLARHARCPLLVLPRVLETRGVSHVHQVAGRS